MTAAFRGEPSIRFRRQAGWNHDLSTVDFAADVLDAEGRKPVVCRVAREALEDRLQSPGEFEPLDLFERFKSEIHAVAGGKIMAGEFEPDGSVLVRSQDLND